MGEGGGGLSQPWTEAGQTGRAMLITTNKGKRTENPGGEKRGGRRRREGGAEKEEKELLELEQGADDGSRREWRRKERKKKGLKIAGEPTSTGVTSRNSTSRNTEGQIILITVTAAIAQSLKKKKPSGIHKGKELHFGGRHGTGCPSPLLSGRQIPTG